MFDRQYYEGRNLHVKNRSHTILAELIHREFPRARVLDLGCGYGFRAELLRQLGHQVIAVDSSEEVVGYPGVTRCDALDWVSTHPRERFNIVIMWQLPQLLSHSYFRDLLTHLCRQTSRIITHLSGDSPVEGDRDDYLNILGQQGFTRDDVELRQRYAPFKFLYYRFNSRPVEMQQPELIRQILFEIAGMSKQIADWDHHAVLPHGPRNVVKCDVVIPYHEANFPWLATSIDSILNQNYAECVIHLIADGFDSPQDPVLHYQNHSQVRWYRNETQIGPYRSLHRIFDRLETDFVAIQDSDDIALPNRIWLSIKTLEDQQGDLVSGSMEQFATHESRTSVISELLEERPYLSSGHGRWYGCPSGNLINGVLTFRKKALEQVNGFTDFAIGGDIEFCERAHRAQLVCIAIPNVLGLRRLHSASNSNSSRTGHDSRARMGMYEKISYFMEIMRSPSFDLRSLGCLDRDRLQHQNTVRLNGNKFRTPKMEIHLSHSCNLACVSCTHYSNYYHKGNLTLQEAETQFNLWSHRISPHAFRLMGGEPTINRDLVGIIELARKHWSESILELVSNGWFLHKHPTLPRILETTRCQLVISIHHQSEEYQRKEKEIRALVDEWLEMYNFQVRWRSSYDIWWRQYHGYASEMKPYQDGDPRASWSVCMSRECLQIHEGKIWKCPPLAYLPMQNEKYRLSAEWKPYLKYRPLEANCTDDELRGFLTREDESFCGMCPSKLEHIEIPSPLRNSSE
jgi:uncharacterized radical SAM superfamily Fe-S cluster-containing enzyme